MKKSTLFISFDGLSDPLGQSQILPYLCGIAAKEYHITILSCEKAERLEKEKANIEKKIQALQIDWNYIIYKESGGFLVRIGYIFKLYFLAKKTCQKNKIQLVHCRSYIAALIGLSLKLNKQIPFIFDMRGFWADERIDGGIWKKSNLLHMAFYSYFKKKEKQFLKYADAIVSLTKTGAEELNTVYPDDGILNKTTIIPCCTDTELFHKKNDNAGFSKSGLRPNDYIIVYTGSIGTWYYTNEMIDCMLVWRKHIPNLKFLILTKDHIALKSILSDYGSDADELIVTLSAAYVDVVDYLSIAKAALFFIKPAYSKIASSPTKMAECWAVDLPIITNAGIGDNNFYFTEQKGGILLKEFTQAAYEKSYKDYLSLNSLQNKYREIALNYFDNKTAIAKYLLIYDSIIK